MNDDYSARRAALDAQRRADIDAKMAAFDDEPTDSPVRQTLAAVADLDAKVDQLVSSFPEDEKAEVLRGLYLDADGNPRTRHRALRPL